MTYELILLVDPAVDLTADKAQKDMVVKVVGNAEAVKDVTSLGKKQLAYVIGKKSEATYLLATLEGTIKSGDISKRVKIIDEVLRFLLTVKE